MGQEIDLDRAKAGGTLRTLAAIGACLFAVGGAYTTLRGDINELKLGYADLHAREEKRSIQDIANALHLQKVDDALEHMTQALDRIDKNVQELRKK